MNIFSDIWHSIFSPFTDWLGGLGAQIGSGIESGVVTAVSDLFGVVVGPLEIAIGILIILWTFLWLFSHQLLNLAVLAAALAK